jgi:hypothetical protein
MAQKHRFRNNQGRRPPGPLAPVTRGLQTPPEPIERRTVVYGKPFVIVEDAAKNTFIFKAGQWLPYGTSIAECKLTCQVKKLAQAVNNMVRYEVRCPVE